MWEVKIYFTFRIVLDQLFDVHKAELVGHLLLRSHGVSQLPKSIKKVPNLFFCFDPSLKNLQLFFKFGKEIFAFTFF